MRVRDGWTSDQVIFVKFHMIGCLRYMRIMGMLGRIKDPDYVALTEMYK